MPIEVKKPKNRLGTPPKKDEPKIKNLTKIPSSELVTLNFKVPAEFRKEYKQYALNKDATMCSILKESFELYKRRNL